MIVIDAVKRKTALSRFTGSCLVVWSVFGDKIKAIIMIDALLQPKQPLLSDVKLPKPMPYRLPKTQLRALYGARNGKMWNNARVK